MPTPMPPDEDVLDDKSLGDIFAEAATTLREALRDRKKPLRNPSARH